MPNILVIEDEEVMRKVLERFFTSTGHQSAFAANGEEGVDLYRQGQFDLVLTDVHMPGMSGWEVANAIREMNEEQGRQCLVAFFTGVALHLQEDKLREYGVSAVVEKPFQFGELTALIERAVAKQKGDEAV